MAKQLVDHSKSFVWYIDGRVSYHFTHIKDWLTEYTIGLDSMIFGGDEYIVVGKGNVYISSRGETLIFFNIYYVSSMEFNLLSESYYVPLSQFG